MLFVSRSPLLLVLALVGCDSVVALDAGLGGDDAQTLLRRGNHHCEPRLTDITVLLASVPDGTRWDELDSAIQDALEDHAEAVFEPNRDAWQANALAAKEALVLADTGAIRDNVDTYVRNQFSDYTDPTFSVDTLASAALAVELRKLYLVHLGTSRNVSGSALDWDGVTPLDRFPLPDARTLADLNAYADDVAVALEGILASGALTAEEASLATEATYVARSLRTGSIGFVAYGGDDLMVAGSLANWGPLPVYDYVLGAIPTAEEYLRYQNAVWMGEIQYVSAHNIAVATDFVGPAAATNPAFYDALLGAEPETSRVALLLAQWWTDRLLAERDADLTCRPYDADERDRQVDSFTADLKLPFDPNYLPNFDARLDQNAASLIVAYQDSAIESLAMFDDVELPPDQRAQVEEAILAETRIGAIIETTQAALTTATGDGALAGQHVTAFAAVPSIGGSAVVNPAHRAVVDRVWTNVRASLVARHASGDRQYELDAHLPATVIVDGQRSIRTVSGDIFVGLGARTNEASLYSVLTHEALHAFDNRAGLNVTGSAVEGAATLTSHPLAREILTEHASADQVPFLNLLTAASVARRYGLSDASVAVLATDCPAGLDSATLAVDTAAAWGASAAALAEAPLRAHWGLQFVSYLGGQFEYEKIVEYFEGQIQPGVDNRIDPFDLHSCGLVTPPLTAEVAADLALCLGL